MQPHDAHSRPPARLTRANYARHLPHLQNRRDASYFVTFVTQDRLILPGEARDIVLRHCVRANGVRLHLHAAVVMPDHVHLLFTPSHDRDGNVYVLAEIMRAIKGPSAREVNLLLQRTGKLWQQESFDRMMRRGDDLRAKAEYICANPERAGLAMPYRWLWREWVEGDA